LVKNTLHTEARKVDSRTERQTRHWLHYLGRYLWRLER